MYLLLSRRHILRIIRFSELFGLNPLELSKEVPTVEALTRLAFFSYSYLLKRTFPD